MAKSEKIDVYQIITDKIVAALEAGTAPWLKPWKVNAPRSMATGKAYRGINVLLLGLMGDTYESNYWGTYKQVTQQGGQIRKGEKSTMITFWKAMKADVKDDAGNPVYENGVRKQKNWMMLRYFNVFNASQADWEDGIPAKFIPSGENEHVPHDEAEKAMKAYFDREGTPSITYGGDSACYAPKSDEIRMPAAVTFDSPDHFYSTAFHEMTHSTGHASRLNRPGITDFDGFATHSYGAEELVAEMGAAMLSATVGIENTLDASASYIQSWLTTIKGDPKMVVQAAGKAAKAVDYILGTVDSTNGKDE